MFVFWLRREGEAISYSVNKNMVYSRKLRLNLMEFLQCIRAEQSSVEVCNSSVNLSRGKNKFKDLRAVWARTFTKFQCRIVCPSKVAGNTGSYCVGNRTKSGAIMSKNKFWALNSKNSFEVSTHRYTFVLKSKKLRYIYLLWVLYDAVLNYFMFFPSTGYYMVSEHRGFRVRICRFKSCLHPFLTK